MESYQYYYKNYYNWQSEDQNTQCFSIPITLTVKQNFPSLRLDNNIFLVNLIKTTLYNVYQIKRFYVLSIISMTLNFL